LIHKRHDASGDSDKLSKAVDNQVKNLDFRCIDTSLIDSKTQDLLDFNRQNALHLAYEAKPKSKPKS